MGWYSMIVVDEKPYMLMGMDTTGQTTVANQTAVVISPTRTSFVFEAGPVLVNATYLSPVVVRFIMLNVLPTSNSTISSQMTLCNNQCRFLTTICPLPPIPHMPSRCIVTYPQVGKLQLYVYRTY